ncbi:MAG: hypothetical protein ACN6I6_00220 [bacterium]|tara:strand:+ start:1518 stop:1820 length:303 start_codon:yes stop_codon:yes gene_type:complete
MKFAFSLLLLLSLKSFGRDLVVIHHHQKSAKQVEILINSLTEQMGFPKSFIKREMSPCQGSEYALAVLCVNDLGEVEIKQQNKTVMKRITAAFGGLRERP